jgi:hypothetical protein
MKKVLLIVILLFKFLIYQHSFADDTLICPAVADVYIDEMSPNENFNYKTRVLISYDASKGRARGLWLFDISEDIDVSDIESASLFLSGSIHTGGGNAIDVYCYALNTSFDDNNDTWNTLSGGDYDSAIFSPGSLPAGNDWETSLDVTDLIKGNLDKLRNNGMLMRLQQEGEVGVDKYQNIASREFVDLEDFAAYIEIIYSGSTSSTTSIYNPPPPPKTTTTTTIKLTSSSTSSTTTSTSTKPTTTTTILVPVPTSTSSIVSTTTTAISICPIEQIYGENSVEVQKIRFIRDNILNTTIEGQTLIRLYYEWSPFLVECIENNGELKIELKEIIDELLQVIQ